MKSATDIRRLPTSEMVARSFPGFKSTGILNVLDQLAWGAPLILKGPKGCLAGSTEIIINRGGKSTRITIKELFRKFHGGTSRGRSWDPDMITYAQIRDANGCGRLGVIEDVVESGVKMTFTLTTAESLSTIRATAKHLFWTKKGWIPLGELEAGMEVSRMVPPARRPHEPKRIYKLISLPQHPYAWSGEYLHRRQGNKTARMERVSLMAYHRVVAEAGASALPVREFIRRVRGGDHAGLVFFDPQIIHVHHKDGNHRNNEPDNLEPLLIEEHLRLHAQLENGSYKNVLWYERWETIKTIEPYGEEPTYDICMASEPHNFTANGFVVHNSGKTLNVEQWAFNNRVPFLRKSCTADTGDRQLLGSHTLKSFDESFFVLGCLSAAIDAANEAGACVLVLEEINALNEEAQKAVNSIADYRQEVDIPHIGRVFRLADPVVASGDGTVVEVETLDAYRSNLVVTYHGHGDVAEYRVPTSCVSPGIEPGVLVRDGAVLVTRPRLWVLGTMNPGYGGTYDLNEDFRSRFQFIEVAFMDAEKEKEILLAPFGARVVQEETNFVGDLQTLAKETRGGKYGYALSTRDLEQCVQAYLRFRSSKHLALKLLEGKFDAAHVTNFQARVKSTFKIDLTTVSLWK